MDKVKYLSRINLFHDMNMEQLQQLEPVTPIEVLKKGTLIASPHREQKRLYLIKSGTVRLYKLSEEGKELNVDILGCGHIFGAIESFTTGAENQYAVALEDCVICTIDKAQFEKLIRERPELALKFIEILSARLKEVEEMLELMAYGSARKRLLYLLYKLSLKFGTPQSAVGGQDPHWVRLEVKLTHQELASITGSIRETVTELLSDFAAEGIVNKEGLRKSLWVQTERLKESLDT